MMRERYVFQGMFIVTFPYTVFEGGYWAIVAMIVIAYVCCYTGKILVDCLYEDVDEQVTECPAGCAKSTENPAPENKSTAENVSSRTVPCRKRVRNSYVEIAETVWGKMIGGRVVFIAQLIELLMTCILYVLLCGELMVGIFPGTSLTLTAWIVISAAPLLPCAFLRSLRHVAWLSFWCTVAHMFINGIILIYCFTRAAEWQWDAVQIKIDIWTFPISLGIVIFSYTSQIFLPSLEGNLVDRTKFAAMMHWTHLAAAIFKAAFSYIGFVTFGTETKEVITNNLPNQTMKVIVNVFLVAKALLSYPLPYFATADLLESKFFRGRPDTTFPPCFDVAGTLKIWALLLRLSLVVVTMLLAIVVPHFAILMGLIGSFTGNMLSLVWPAYFHLAIKGRRMGYPKMVFDLCIILLGLTCSGLGIYYSFHALVRAFEGFEPKPFQAH